MAGPLHEEDEHNWFVGEGEHPDDEVLTQLKEDIDLRFGYWIKILGLSRWTIVLHYHRHPCPADDRRSMGVTPMWEYNTADVDIWLPTIHGTGVNVMEIDHYIVHELVHCIVEPLSGKGKKGRYLEEKVVSDLTDGILTAFKQEAYHEDSR